MKNIRWHIIGLITAVTVAVLFGVWKALITKATPDWIRRDKQRAAIRAKAMTIVNSGSPDTVADLIPLLGTDASDIAVWGLGRIGPGAAPAVRELESLERQRIEKARSHLSSRNYDPLGKPEALERISGCTTGQPSRLASYFQDFHRHTKIDGWQGNISGVSSPMVEVVADQAAWQNLWRRHGAHPTCRPEIDFRNQIVIGIFLGTTTHTEFPRMGDISENSSGVTVHYYDTYSDALSDSPSTPYIFIRIKRPSTPLKVVRTVTYAMSRTPKKMETEMALYVPRK